MIEVIVSWIYIFLTCGITGCAFIKLLSRGSGYSVKSIPGCLVAGLGLITVYSETFSIFYKVGRLANTVLCIACIFLSIYIRNEAMTFYKEVTCRENRSHLIAVVILIPLFALGTSSGYMHYDSDLYHAQSIRWIEEYGAVLGLGNLHTRLAYNSAAFPLTALYSFRFILGHSLHTTSGFYALLLAGLCTGLFRRDVFKKPRISDLVRLSAIYYLCSAFDGLVAPASDFFIVLPVFITVILWLDLIERNEESYVPYALLSLYAAVIISYKLSGAFVVLIMLKPAYMLLKGGGVSTDNSDGINEAVTPKMHPAWKQISLYLLLGVLAIAPYIVRNVMLSGYLVYPVTAIDIFKYDFKIPEEIALYDSREVRVYARGYIDISRFDEPIRVWFPAWFKSLGRIDSLVFLTAALELPLGILCGLYILVKKKKELYEYLFITAVMGVCFIFWFFNAPLMRYGCVFVYLFPALVTGLLFKLAADTGKIKRELFAYTWKVSLLLFCAYKAVLFGKELYVMREHYAGHILYQQGYGDYSDIADTYEIDGITFFYPTEGDRIGYDYFPSSPTVRDIHLRGESIEDGFVARK